MTEKIQSRPFQYGDEKESDWPPQLPKGHGFRGYWDSEKQKFVEGDPPRRKTYGTAPQFITDSMPETVHPKTGETVDSRSRWNAIDKANGCFTTGSKEDTGSIKKKKDIKAEDDEMVGRIKRAVSMIDSGTAPLPEKLREQSKQQNEILSKALGFDAGNVLGAKRNERTKKYRRK